MAVSDSVIVDRMMWGGYDQKNLPTGLWVGRVSIVGDLSGGNSVISLVFQDGATVEKDANMYSLEQLACLRSGSASGCIASLSVQNMGVFPTRGVLGDLGVIWSVTLAQTEGAEAAAGLGELVIAKSIFLGGQVQDTTETGLRLICDNDVDGAVFRMTAMGYIWGSRSRSAQGGPLKPPSGLW